VEKMNRVARRLYIDFKNLTDENRKIAIVVAIFVLCLVIYIIAKASDKTVYVYHNDSQANFKDAKIFGNQGKNIYEGKDALYSKSIKSLADEQKLLNEKNDKILARLDEVEKAKAAIPVATPQPVGSPSNGVGATAPVRSYDNPYTENSMIEPSSGQSRRRGSGLGTSVITFPVKGQLADDSVSLPSGSYVKAKLMTGVMAPEGKTYPALLQLDFAYILPNKHKLDLAGCFMIAKSQGDLSTERVQMQATKLSCVSKTGAMFEREVNGFIADDKDNSFAVSGTVNSKQDRVAAMAFLSSIVEGVSKAIQQAQTTQTMTPLGGAQSTVTGDQASYMAAGGAANAAGLVTQWYLKQAQNLLPTISVVSGRDVWIVMQDTVKLPETYFRKNESDGQGSIYSYLSRLNE
jgi:hypothetical protein